MPIDGGLVGRVILVSGTTGQIQAGLLSAGTARTYLGPSGYTGPGHHAEANLLAGADAFITAEVAREGGVIAAIHFYTSHSPCTACKDLLVHFKNTYNARFTSWQFGWGDHWYAPGLLDAVQAANTLVAQRQAALNATTTLVTQRNATLALATTTHQQLMVAIANANLTAAGRINIQTALTAAAATVGTRTAERNAAVVQQGVDQAALNQAGLQRAAANLAVAQHLLAQNANLAALTTAGWAVSRAP